VCVCVWWWCEAAHTRIRPGKHELGAGRVSNLVCVDKQLDDTNTCVRGRVVAEGNVGFLVGALPNEGGVLVLFPTDLTLSAPSHMQVGVGLWAGA
jgi:hypothetical protein